MPPIIGLLVMDIYVSDAATLKDKRGVVKSLIDRLGNRYNVSVAEIDQLDDRARATLAVVNVANDRAHVESVLSHVLATAEGERRAVVEGSYTEII